MVMTGGSIKAISKTDMTACAQFHKHERFVEAEQLERDCMSVPRATPNIICAGFSRMLEIAGRLCYYDERRERTSARTISLPHPLAGTRFGFRSNAPLASPSHLTPGHVSELISLTVLRRKEGVTYLAAPSASPWTQVNPPPGGLFFGGRFGKCAHFVNARAGADDVAELVCREHGARGGADAADWQNGALGAGEQSCCCCRHARVVRVRRACLRRGRRGYGKRKRPDVRIRG
ncbi:hypothetical protein DFH11DRAFT_1665098 [Phellopilus nigrolimitatus]|nr:hypothetical protein DFH11DRAFT_1665098 [Phellopilus nigrolimitatus]